jgi:hypothetical protein
MPIYVGAIDASLSNPEIRLRSQESRGSGFPNTVTNTRFLGTSLAEIDEKES